MGLKLFIVCGLALVMTIPGFFVDDLVDERTHRANDVVREISNHVGGQQTFLGPTLAIPYSFSSSSPDGSRSHGVYLVFPTQGSATVKTQTEERRRSLFKVPVFQADLSFNASFDLTGVPAAAGPNVEFDWNRAEFIVGVSDARGALTDGTLTIGGKAMTLVPAGLLQGLSLGSEQSQKTNLALFGAKAVGVQPNTQFNAATTLRFSGAQRITVLAYGKSTRVSVQGDWRNPSFDGGFLPLNRSVAPSGFSADWSVPFIARGV